ncbi:MAG: hypothetical protein QOE68_2622 [Thermoanaerobaculia bacterium]|nr:hypothetical protein [Thermoanaerobaculia bacterium]
MNAWGAQLLFGGAITLACAMGGQQENGFDAITQAIGDETIDSWVLMFEIDRRGKPKVTLFRDGRWPVTQIAPCAPAAHVRDVRAGTLPTGAPPYATTVRRDAIVTTLDSRGDRMCNRIYPVTIEQAIEIPPLPDGKTGWAWTSSHNDPKFFTAQVPKQRVAAIRVSGWRGLRPTTFTIADLKKRFSTVDSQ